MAVHPGRGPGRRTSVGLAAALIVAIAINLIQFRSIEDNTSHHFAAIHRYEDLDTLAAVGERRNRTFRQMYGLYLALAHVAPDSTVLVPGGTRLSQHEFVGRMYGYGQVDEVKIVPAPEVAEEFGAAGENSGFDPSPYVIAHGPGGERAPPWLLAVDTRRTPATGMPEPERFLRTSLQADEPVGDVSREPREFLLVEWGEPLPDAEFPVQDLLVETSLLPDDLRRELQP